MNVALSLGDLSVRFFYAQHIIGKNKTSTHLSTETVRVSLISNHQPPRAPKVNVLPGSCWVIVLFCCTSLPICAEQPKALSQEADYVKPLISDLRNVETYDQKYLEQIHPSFYCKPWEQAKLAPRCSVCMGLYHSLLVCSRDYSNHVAYMEIQHFFLRALQHWESTQSLYHLFLCFNDAIAHPSLTWGGKAGRQMQWVKWKV